MCPLNHRPPGALPPFSAFALTARGGFAALPGVSLPTVACPGLQANPPSSGLGWPSAILRSAELYRTAIKEKRKIIYVLPILQKNRLRRPICISPRNVVSLPCNIGKGPRRGPFSLSQRGLNCLGDRKNCRPNSKIGRPSCGAEGHSKGFQSLFALQK